MPPVPAGLPAGHPRKGRIKFERLEVGSGSAVTRVSIWACWSAFRFRIRAEATEMPWAWSFP